MKIISTNLLLCLGFIASHAQAQKKEIWVYTSMYKEFITPMKNAFEAKNKDVSVKVFQSGSEKIQAKVEAELIAKRPQADLVMISDPFYLALLEKRGLLAKRSNGSFFENNYYSVMVILCHKNVPQEQRPKSFADLTKPAFKNQVQMGSPLESGTMFSFVAYMSRKHGWKYFELMRDNKLASNGGNSTVIQKIESGEKKCGVALIENVLASQKKGSPIEVIYPADGSFVIPSTQGTFASSKNVETANAFGAFVMSKEGQQIVRTGFMHSIRDDVDAPDGSKKLKEIADISVWDKKFISEVGEQSKEIKKKFSQLILE